MDAKMIGLVNVSNSAQLPNLNYKAIENYRKELEKKYQAMYST